MAFTLTGDMVLFVADLVCQLESTPDTIEDQSDVISRVEKFAGI